MTRPSQKTLEERLTDGVVIGAEGYVFELERRGYIQAGPFVPRQTGFCLYPFHFLRYQIVRNRAEPSPDAPILWQLSQLFGGRF